MKFNCIVSVCTDGKTQVLLKGTPEQLNLAERYIKDTLLEVEQMDQKVKTSVESRSPRTRNPKPPTLFLTSDNSTNTSPAVPLKDSTERLIQVAGEKSIGVFVSAISDPGRFYVQKVCTSFMRKSKIDQTGTSVLQVGPKSVDLDKLVQEMTDYYRVETNRQSHALTAAEVKDGDVVASMWPGDERWYRARVVEVVRDEYDENAEPMLDLDFVDFGDCDKMPLGEVYDLRTNFLSLSFQAIECCLAGIEPA